MTKNGKKHPKTEETETVVVESLDAAATLTGYARESLQQWKRDGCPAFKQGNRINLPELAMWLVDNPQTERRNSPTLIMQQLEVREMLLKIANTEQKLAERRKLFFLGTDGRKAMSRAVLAFKVKCHTMAVKLSQPLALMNEPRDIQKAINIETCAMLDQMERGEWFDADEVAKWLATQPEILKKANELEGA